MDVTYREKQIGHINWNPDHWGANVSLRCAIPGDTLQLLRCYAVTQTGLLLIGLPEPRGGQLVLTRHLSTEVLRNAGCDTAPPTVFFLSDAATPVVPPTPPQDKPEPEPAAETSSASTTPPAAPVSATPEPEPSVETSSASATPPAAPASATSEPEPSAETSSAAAIPPAAPASSTPEPQPSAETLPMSAELCTGDSILDELIAQRRVAATQEHDAIVLTCPFAPDLPFALAPAFVLCAVQDGQAILRYDAAATVPESVTVPEPVASEAVTIPEPAVVPEPAAVSGVTG